jgi:hypothetical protein
MSPAPGSAYGLYPIVSDIEAARNGPFASGVDVSDVFLSAMPGVQFQPDGASGRVSGPAPNRASYRSFATFSDLDSGGWLLQEGTTRLPGRVDSALTSFNSARDLASALRRAADTHGEHEKRIGAADPLGQMGAPDTWLLSKQAQGYCNERRRSDRFANRKHDTTRHFSPNALGNC